MYSNEMPDRAAVYRRIDAAAAEPGFLPGLEFRGRNCCVCWPWARQGRVPLAVMFLAALPGLETVFYALSEADGKKSECNDGGHLPNPRCCWRRCVVQVMRGTWRMKLVDTPCGKW